MAINIGENNDKEVTYVNSPDINRVLFKNLSEGASEDEIAEAVNAWIEEHPEAVTTVQDGSILPVKLDSSNEPSDGYVLSWNATAGKFEWIDIQSDITELKNDFSDLESTAMSAYVTETASGAIASFSDGADGVPVKDMTVQIEPVQSGSGDPAPDNVRPISGWTGVNVSRTGKNLLVKPLAHISKAPNSLDECFPIKAGTYNLKVGSFTGATSWRFGIRMKDKDGNNLSAYTYKPSQWMSWNTPNQMWLGGSNNTELAWAFTIVEDCYVRVVFGVGDTTADTVANDAILGFGSTATDYEPYQGNTYSITFPTEAGTVYGGTLDVTTGVLTRTMRLLDMGELTWHYYSSGDYFYATVGSRFKNGENGIGLCSMYKYFGNNTGTYLENNLPDKSFGFTTTSTNKYVYIRDNDYTTESAFIEAVTGKQLMWTLETPQTYQLTPQEVSTLLGLNNIWADTGDVEVDYRADTKLYIENLTAPTEDDMTANTTIPDASYFMVGNTLYLSTTTIPAGDTINPGTNCTKMSLAEALNAINS